MKPLPTSFLSIATFTALSLPAMQVTAAPLKEARVTKIINDVKLVDPEAGARAAAVDDVVRDQIALQTGIKSRSELQFTDKTLTRIGPETYFSFNAGTRDITLDRGTMLLEVPKGLGGATIHTAAVTASITGTTIMIEHRPGRDIKVLVLEGSLRLSVNGHFGDSLLLTPGKMIIMKPDAKRIPDPVTVDLARLTKTSSLVNMPGSKKASGVLPSLPLIEQAIADQAKDKDKAELINTNLVIQGSGTNVTFGDPSLQLINELSVLDTKRSAEPSPTIAPGDTPAPTPTPSPTASPHSSATPTPSPYKIVFNQDGTISSPVTAANVQITAGHNLTIAAQVTAQLGTFAAGHDLNFNSTADVQDLTLVVGHDFHYNVPLLAAASNGTMSAPPSDGRTLTIEVRKLDLKNVGQGVSPVTLNGGDAALSSSFEGGDGGILNIGTASNPVAGDVTLSSDVSATTGGNAAAVSYGGAGGSVNVTTDGQAKINSTIKVSDVAAGHASKSGGSIHITSKRTSGPAISVSSSAQLLALLSNAAPGPGRSIIFTSAGGDINVNGTVKADRGLVEITNNGPNGKVTLANATLHGETVKAGALGNNGSLNIGGGTIDANTAIKLYAGGSNGHVNFTNNVTLSGNSVKTIAADAVTIFKGKVVTVLGNAPANVFTNQPNYTGFGGNGSTTGTFAGQGATTQPLSALPSGY
jgi:hypothetical protein